MLAQLAQAPPAGQASWTGESLAAALGDVSLAYVRRVLRAQGIHLQRRLLQAHRKRWQSIDILPSHVAQQLLDVLPHQIVQHTQRDVRRARQLALAAGNAAAFVLD